MSSRIVDVLVPVALDQAYSYRVPAGLTLDPGDVVSVPLGAREVMGVVWGEGNPRPGLHNRLKDIDARLDIPPLKDELRSFVDWVSNYTLAPRGMVLRMTLRMGDLGPARERVGVRKVGPAPARMTPARARVLSVLSDGMTRAKSDVTTEAGVSPGVIDGLVDEGTLEAVVLPPDPIARAPDPDFFQPDFSPAQAEAAEKMRGAVRRGEFSATLIDGVTGSGKTEVYFEAVAEAVRAGKQCLVLTPEIALTAQFLDRFAQRFGTRPAEWHSQLPPRKRARTWSAVAANEVQVIVGARSALFLPFADLGLIVVDEEHDPAYKQEDGAHYHARDMAIVRARGLKIPAVLASATPSVESEVNARRGRYERLSLPERFGGQYLPAVEAIDSRRSLPKPFALSWRRKSRRCSFSIAAASRRSLCAVPAAIACNARTAIAGWSIIASSGGSSATFAASRRRHPPNARSAMPLKASSRSAPASNGLNRKPPSCFRMRARWCCRATSSNPSSVCAVSSTMSRRESSTSLSGPSSSPRATIFRSSIWSASSMPISDWAMAIHAPPSAHSSFCIRWSAALAALRASGRVSCRPISRSIR
jgi:hypothetical protein